MFRTLREDLDPGASAALAHAVHRQTELVLVDDRKARLAATRLGLTSRGTIGILIEVKREGHIDRIAPTLVELLNAGIWLAPSLVRAALDAAGEGGSTTNPLRGRSEPGARDQREPMLAARTVALDDVEGQAQSWLAGSQLDDRLRFAESELNDAQVRLTAVTLATTVALTLAGNFLASAARGGMTGL